MQQKFWLTNQQRQFVVAIVGAVVITAGMSGTAMAQGAEGQILLTDCNEQNVLCAERTNNNQQDNTRQDGEINAVEEANTRQDGEINAVEEANTRQDGEINAVEEANTRQDGEIDAVEEANTRQDQELTDVRTVNTRQDQELTDIRTVNTRQDQELTDIRTVNTRQDQDIATNRAGIAENANRINNAFDQIDENTQGIAIAIAMGGLILPSDKKFALSASLGFYDDKTAIAAQGAVRLNSTWTLNGGLGFGADGNRKVGGRIGISAAW